MSFDKLRVLRERDRESFTWFGAGGMVSGSSTMVAVAAAGGRNMEVGMDVKATAAATPAAGGLYTSYNGSLTPQQELTDDDGDDVENSSSSKGKLLVASEAAQLEALERRLSVRHLALQFETGQVNSHAEAAANKLAQETTTDHVLEVVVGVVVAKQIKAASTHDPSCCLFFVVQ